MKNCYYFEPHLGDVLTVLIESSTFHIKALWGEIFSKNSIFGYILCKSSEEFVLVLPLFTLEIFYEHTKNISLHFQ